MRESGRERVRERGGLKNWKKEKGESEYLCLREGGRERERETERDRQRERRREKNRW